jgi:glycyl-tRNA synthetase beta chain
VAELLLELLSEEIPARMQARAAEDLKRLVTEGLKKARLTYTSAAAYVTPRRLALVVEGIPERLPDATEERRGPRVGSPEQAIRGFLKSVELDSLDQCEIRDVKGNEYYFAVLKNEGWETIIYLGDFLTDVVRDFPWPKSMRWGVRHGRWVRPLQNVLCLFGPQTGILITLEPGTAFRTRETVGHRFLSPDRFEVTGFADYETKLRAAHVILDREERKEIIAAEAVKLAEAEGLTLKDDPGLLNEVTGLVEWPVVLMGTIDAEFMDLPPEVLVSSMRGHQKYFSTLDAEGNLADRFIVVANTETADGGAVIVAGNERVLRARLADARFFWEQDRGRTLASRAPDLRQMVFHEKLGTLDDKADRMQALVAALSDSIPGADKDRVRSAARLAKADLTTGMVGEFPELQGVMGRYYALADGEHAEVAEAVAEHYAPLGPNDACPSAPASVAVALADKIDTLVGFWAIGETPTGSKDPYALRRAALGVIRLIVENELRIPLSRIFQNAYLPIGYELELRSTKDFDYVGHISSKHLTEKELDDENIEALWEHGGFRTRALESEGTEIASQLLDFFADRLKVALRDKGVRHDLVSAVFALGGEDDLVRLLARVGALEAFLGSEDGEHLLVAYRRAANIVRIEEKRDGARFDGVAEAERFVQDEETALSEALGVAAAAAEPALGQEDFTAAMAAMAALRQPVDAFFDHVTVNAEDAALRENRLRLLNRIGATLGRVADFSRIEG